jgi:hypothetical protein
MLIQRRGGAEGEMEGEKEIRAARTVGIGALCPFPSCTRSPSPPSREGEGEGKGVVKNKEETKEKEAVHRGHSRELLSL